MPSAPFYRRFRRFSALSTAVVCLLIVAGGCAQLQDFTGGSPSSPRERESINSGWRFTKNDPDGTGDKLAYANMKNWMMATGEDLSLLDPAAPKRTRPQGNIGGDVSYTQPGFDDSSWRQLDLPHDWAVEGEFDIARPGGTGKLPFAGVGWYRKKFDIPAADIGKQFYIDIDGAMSYPNIWLNGQYAGGWGYGYSSFRVDLTPYVKPGENVLSIRLDNPDASSRWYPGAGIYRNVWLVKAAPVHVAQWGTFITTPDATDGSATVDLKVSVDNNTNANTSVVVKSQIFPIDINDRRTGGAVASTDAVTLQVPAGKIETVATKATVSRPKLWSVASPNRYVAITTVEQDGKVVDAYETPFGIRTVKFDPEKGVVLNGVAMKFFGVCQHHDLVGLGSATYVRGLQRQLEILQEMGTNAIRTSHNPPSPELLDLCDKMGFMVMDETFDCWERGKTANDYNLLFPEWSEKDTRMLVRRDRNHPSVVAWSIGNEIAEQGNAAGHAVGQRLANIIKSDDTTRPITAGCNNYNAGSNGFQNIVDIFGYNYLRPQATNFAMYSAFREVPGNEKKFVYSSESASTLSTRGFYVFPVGQDKGGGFDAAAQQMSSYDLFAPGWATPPDWEWEAQDRVGYPGGEFVWTGFDYLGEPTVTGGGGGGGRGRRGGGPATGPATAPGAAGAPAAPAGAADAAPGRRGGGRGGLGGGPPNPRRSSYFGIIDLAGFKKDRFYIYQARWRPDLKMAHILPHWNWEDRVGQVTPVHVYTTGDEGELFVNGKSQGRRKKGTTGLVNLQTNPDGPALWMTDKYRLMWNDVVYEPGEVKVVTYKNGQPWAEAVMKTTGAASKLTATPDRKTISADGQDLSFVTVAVADNAGAMVPKTMNLLKFEVSGPGEIVAVDNGDPTSLVSFKSKEMKAFNGLCLVIVRAKPGQAGNIVLKAQSDGLAAGEVVISARR